MKWWFASLNFSVTLEVQTIPWSWVAGWLGFHKSGLSNKSPAEFRTQCWNLLCQWVPVLCCKLGVVSVCMIFLCVSHSFHKNGDSHMPVQSLVSSHDLQLFTVFKGLSGCAFVCVCAWSGVCVAQQCDLCVQIFVCVLSQWFHNGLKSWIIHSDAKLTLVKPHEW